MKHISQATQENTKLSEYKLMLWTEESIKNFWDFESLFPENYFTFQNRNKLTEFILPYIKSHHKVLDYGAGKGFLTQELLKKGIKTATYDLSKESSEASRKKFSSQPNYIGSFNNNTINENHNKFNVVFLIEVIEHLESNVRSQVLEQIHSLLKEDGILIITTPNEEDLTKNLILNPSTKEIFHRWQHCYSWSATSLAEVIEKNSFKVLSTHTINLKHIGPSPLTSIKRLLKKHKKQPHLIAICKKNTANN